MLLDEVVEALSPREGEVMVDCTAGLGGHAAAIAERLGPDGVVVLIDLDPGNLERAAARVRGVARAPRVVMVRGNFAGAGRLAGEALGGRAADMVLADLGFASTQIDDPERGLSFSGDGPLDMRFDPSGPTTAAELVNTLPEADLARIIFEFGEERNSRRVAAAIVAARREEAITTTGRLAEIVRSAMGGGRWGSGGGRGGRTGKGGARGGKGGGIDPATRTFQALRIAVNDELGNLDALLAAIGRGAAEAARGQGGLGPGWLAAGARIAIISFHSLEDRPVKRAFFELAARGLAVHLARGPVGASEAEIARNPRSRSAKLRAVRIVGGD